MPAAKQTIVLGMGSNHGDDRIGWRIAESLQKIGLPGVLCQQITTPIEIVDWLENAAQIHVVDAASEMDAPVRRLSYSCQSQRSIIANLPNHGTHDLGVYQALQLAESLERRTDHVQLWLVAGAQFRPFAPLSAEAEQSIHACIDLLSTELNGRDDASH